MGGSGVQVEIGGGGVAGAAVAITVRLFHVVLACLIFSQHLRALKTKSCFIAFCFQGNIQTIPVGSFGLIARSASSARVPLRLQIGGQGIARWNSHGLNLLNVRVDF